MNDVDRVDAMILRISSLSVADGAFPAGLVRGKRPAGAVGPRARCGTRWPLDVLCSTSKLAASFLTASSYPMQRQLPGAEPLVEPHDPLLQDRRAAVQVRIRDLFSSAAYSATSRAPLRNSALNAARSRAALSIGRWMPSQILIASGSRPSLMVVTRVVVFPYGTPSPLLMRPVLLLLEQVGQLVLGIKDRIAELQILWRHAAMDRRLQRSGSLPVLRLRHVGACLTSSSSLASSARAIRIGSST